MLPYARLVSLSPEQQRSIEGLVAQVNVDNVLDVPALLRRQADSMELALYDAQRSLRLVPLGQDPVSRDATSLFQTKIDQILAVHWAHHTELCTAVDALRACALEYGFTDLDLESSFRNLASA